MLRFIGAYGGEVGWVDTCDCGVVGNGCPTNDGGPWTATTYTVEVIADVNLV